MNNQFMTVDEVANACGVSKTKAYKIIRNMNADLEKSGYLTIAGKVSRAYFRERIYSGSGNEG